MAMRPKTQAELMGPSDGVQTAQESQQMRLDAIRKAMMDAGIIKPEEFSYGGPQPLGATDFLTPTPGSLFSGEGPPENESPAQMGDFPEKNPQSDSLTPREDKILRAQRRSSMDKDLNNSMTPNPYGQSVPEPEKDAPKAELDRFGAVGEMDFDKVARPPGDPFVYAMKGGKIFVMNPKKPNEGFRDVTGIQNAAAIRGVIAEFGETPGLSDREMAEKAGIMPALKAGVTEDEAIRILLDRGPSTIGRPG